MATTVDTSLLDSALAYAAMGWRVFPVGTDKRPLTPHGFQDASTHEGLIHEWFSPTPSANIALDIPEDIVVLDFDPRNGAPDPFVFSGFGETLLATTPSGGMHVYFQIPPNVETNGKWMPGIDIKRGGKGYVLLPPSRREDGKTYEWYKGEDILDGWLAAHIRHAIKQIPEWVLAAIRRETVEFSRFSDTPTAEPTFPWETGTKYGIYGLEQQLGMLIMAREGDRNNQLNRVGFRVGQLVAAGELKEQALHEVARVAELIGLEKDEVYLTLKSSYEKGMRRPWTRGQAAD